MNPYSVLGIGRNADEEEIKKAYRDKAKKHHPDRGGDEEEFKNIQKAYEEIKNEDEFDSSFEGFNNPNINYGQEKSVEDFIRDFQEWSQHTEFGGPDFGSRKRRAVNVDFETSVFGEKDLNIGRATIDVPAGVRDGTELFFPDVGSQIVFNVSNNTKYWRKNRNDIYVEESIPVWEAMVGEKIEVRTLDGKKVRTSIEPGPKVGSTFRFRGMGGPETFDNKPRGDFYVKLDINIPKITDSKDIERIEQLRNELES